MNTKFKLLIKEKSESIKHKVLRQFVGIPPLDLAHRRLQPTQVFLVFFSAVCHRKRSTDAPTDASARLSYRGGCGGTDVAPPELGSTLPSTRQPVLV